MARNYNIQTARKSLITGTMKASRTAVASSVATGMTRYVTFVRLEGNSANSKLGSRVYLASAAATVSTTALASAGLKMVLELNSAYAMPKAVQHPPRIDTENPLFTIAAGKYLIVAKSALQLGSNPCTLFVQYYDQ